MHLYNYLEMHRHITPQLKGKMSHYSKLSLCLSELLPEISNIYEKQGLIFSFRCFMVMLLNSSSVLHRSIHFVSPLSPWTIPSRPSPFLAFWDENFCAPLDSVNNNGNDTDTSYLRSADIRVWCQRPEDTFSFT